MRRWPKKRSRSRSIWYGQWRPGAAEPDPVKQDEHRDVKIYAVGEVHFAVCGKWIIATNKRLLAWMTIENYLTPGLGAERRRSVPGRAKG